MSESAFTAHDYVLGELDGARLAAAEARLLSDPEFAAEVERLRPLVSALQAVPDEEWERIPPLETEQVADRRRPRRILGLSPAVAGGAAVAVAAAVVAIVLIATGGGAGRPLELAALPGSGGDASGQVRLDDSSGTARVAVAGLAPSHDGEYYELWLLNDVDDLVSLGSFRVGKGGEAELDLPVPVDPQDYRYLDLSVEADDGDASHSGDSVLRGPTSES